MRSWSKLFLFGSGRQQIVQGIDSFQPFPEPWQARAGQRPACSAWLGPCWHICLQQLCDAQRTSSAPTSSMAVSTVGWCEVSRRHGSAWHPRWFMTLCAPALLSVPRSQPHTSLQPSLQPAWAASQNTKHRSACTISKCAHVCMAPQGFAQHMPMHRQRVGTPPHLPALATCQRNRTMLAGAVAVDSVRRPALHGCQRCLHQPALPCVCHLAPHLHWRHPRGLQPAGSRVLPVPGGAGTDSCQHQRADACLVLDHHHHDSGALCRCATARASMHGDYAPCEHLTHNASGVLPT